VAVRRLDLSAHLTQRLRDALHRTRAQRLVAGEFERSALRDEDTEQEPHQGAGVRAVDGSGFEAAQADAVDDELVLSDLVDARAERAHRRDGRHRVGGAPEADDARLAFADRAEEDGAVRDRLVAGNLHVPDERCGRLDLHSSSGATSTA
jgi:hypothetical protein